MARKNIVLLISYDRNHEPELSGALGDLGDLLFRVSPDVVGVGAEIAHWHLTDLACWYDAPHLLRSTDMKHFWD